MRIALTHNLRISDAEEEAEFDSEQTVTSLASAIERLGHRVERMEVSGPASRTVARLEAFSPDLIFNTAEGRRGRFREAFFPALFDELGFPYTGSDAYALAVTLDKQLTKLILREEGLRTPGWQFIEKQGDLKPEDLHFPVIVKPNFEGSSKGITQDSVAENVEALKSKVADALARYPAGVLVEEFIVGRDLTVPFLELVDNDFDGVLAPVFRQAQRHLTRYAARLVEEDETEDVVQETLLKFVMQRRRERDTGGGRPRARERAEPLPPLSKRDVIIRLTVMLKDVVIDRERARRKETKMMRLISGASATIRRHMSTRRRVEDDEIRSAIQYALLRLPAYMREPWVMVKEQGFSVDETAHHFGITRASVRAAMAEANRAMRPHLERFGITPDIIRGRDIE